MFNLTFDQLGIISLLISVIMSVIGIFLLVFQIWKNNMISRAQFWLELEKMFVVHDKVHIKLRPGGE